MNPLGPLREVFQIYPNHTVFGPSAGSVLNTTTCPNPANFGPFGFAGGVPYTTACPNPPIVGNGAPPGMRSVPTQPWHRPPWFNPYPVYPYPGMSVPYGMSSVPPSDMTNQLVKLFEDFQKSISEQISQVPSMVSSLESNVAKQNSHTCTCTCRGGYWRYVVCSWVTGRQLPVGWRGRTIVPSSRPTQISSFQCGFCAVWIWWRVLCPHRGWPWGWGGFLA